jgi:hypothetical protein
LAAPLLILFVLPVFTAGWWKYLLPYQPLIFILAARGAECGKDWLVKLLNAPVAAHHALLVLFNLVVALTFILPQVPRLSGAKEIPQSDRVKLSHVREKAGKWAQDKFGTGRRYSIPWSRLVYYLDGYWIAAPMADYPSQLAYLWKHRAEFVVTELTGVEALETLDQERVAPPGMEFAGEYVSTEYPYVARFYKLVPP